MTPSRLLVSILLTKLRSKHEGGQFILRTCDFLVNLLKNCDWSKYHWSNRKDKIRNPGLYLKHHSQQWEQSCLVFPWKWNWIKSELDPTKLKGGKTCFRFVTALKVQMLVCIGYLQRHSRAGWGKHKHILWWVRTECLFLPNWVCVSTAPLQMSATWFPSVFFFSLHFSCFYILPSICFFFSRSPICYPV